MSTNLQNSIWPNEGGTLGQIKVQIPTGTANDPWPTGDALVHNFVYHNGKLVGFVDTKALIANSSKTTIFPYDYVNISLPSIAEGEMTYNHDQCAYFILNGKVIKGDIPTDEDDVPSDDDLEIITKKYTGCKTLADIKAVDPNYLTNDIIDGVWSNSLADLEDGSNGWGNGMFWLCKTLTTFNSDLSSLTNGAYMFYESNVSEFTSDLPSLTNGDGMFTGCENLESFTSDSSGSPVNLSSLTTGRDMFYKTKLTSFNYDLSSLTTCSSMFSYCKQLNSFSSNLSSLTNGRYMFQYCSSLNSFSSNLSSLTNGYYMFYDCKLDTASVQNIADTIKNVNGLYNDGMNDVNTQINIGIGNSEPNEQEKTAFNTMVSKGWTVYVNGSHYTPSAGGYYTYAANASLASSLTTLDEMGESEMFAPKPYWAKPINSDEQNARYVDSEGNFYDILGAQFVYGDNLETYGMFIDEDDAAAQMRLTKIEK